MSFILTLRFTDFGHVSNEVMGEYDTPSLAKEAVQAVIPIRWYWYFDDQYDIYKTNNNSTHPQMEWHIKEYIKNAPIKALPYGIKSIFDLDNYYHYHKNDDDDNRGNNWSYDEDQGGYVPRKKGKKGVPNG